MSNPADRIGDPKPVGPETRRLQEIFGSASLRELVGRLPRVLNGTVRTVAYGVQIYDAPKDLVRVVSLLRTMRPADAEIHAESPEVREEMESGYPSADTPFSLLLKTEERVYIEDLAQEPRFHRTVDMWRRAGVSSLVYLPLRVNGNLVGALFCGSPEAHAFQPHVLELLGILVDHIALAIRNCLDQEQMERSRLALARERDRLRILLQVAKATSTALDTFSLMRAIFFELHKYFEHQVGSVVRYAPETGDFEMLYADLPHDVPRSATSTRISMDRSASGQAFRAQRTFLFRIGEDVNGLGWSDNVLAKYGFTWMCSIPLTTTRGRLGVMNLGGVDASGPSSEQLEFLEHLASHVAIALERTIVLDELQLLNQRLARENLVLQEEIRGDHHFEEIVGRSEALANVLRQVEVVADTDATVLILGESGTGKELVARAIHRLSRRQTKPFVKINCAAIPSGLLESELFGHEKGAFTGAIAQKAGRFELASEGTIFLDEVGEIPLEVQPKLLRVLQDMEFERLGSSKTIHANVRVIAATNRDLKEMVRAGSFREDLYYRLHVFPVTNPPLRDRRDDIPLLVQYFVQQSSRKLGRYVTRIPDHVMAAMKSYLWPGNVRELENFVERAVILSRGANLQAPLVELGVGTVPADATALTMDEAERRIILEALDACDWVIGGKNGAAARLAMKRTTLQSRMAKLGIQRPAASQANKAKDAPI